MNKVTAATRTVTAQDLIELTAVGCGVIIEYCGERFDVERAHANGYGAVLIYDHFGTCHGLSDGATVPMLGSFNL